MFFFEKWSMAVFSRNAPETAISEQLMTLSPWKPGRSLKLKWPTDKNIKKVESTRIVVKISDAFAEGLLWKYQMTMTYINFHNNYVIYVL